MVILILKISSKEVVAQGLRILLELSFNIIMFLPWVDYEADYEEMGVPGQMLLGKNHS